MQNITVTELKARLDAGEKIHLIDVREPAEYDEVNINGLLVPLGKIRNMETEELDAWKNEEVIVHCRSGVRSAQACMLLEQMGFTNTKNVEGGIMAWLQAFGR
jgi:rhodanese-related sulfurtransferase